MLSTKSSTQTNGDFDLASATLIPGHEGGGLRLEAEAMRSAARAAFHADHEPLHAVVSQEVAATS